MAKLVQSHVHGATSPPLIADTIGNFFDQACARWAASDALIVRQQGVRWTYAELKQHVDKLAAGLVALGLKPGERIGIWSPNNAEWALTQFATAKAGLILVNINPAYRLTEADYVLNKVGCRALIIATQFKTSDYVAMVNQLRAEGRLPQLDIVIRIGGASPGMMDFAEVAARARPADHERIAALAGELDMHDAINIQFTSGTTGHPKGATLTHHNILNNGFIGGEILHYTHKDRVCIPVPLYHCFGMVIGNLACMTHGSAMVYPSEGFDPLATLQAVSEERCTSLYGVPTMFIAMLGHPDFKSFDLTSLRTGVMAGSPCPIEVMKRVIGEMNMREVTICYGMTETSPVSFQSAISDPIERRVSTVGRVHPHVEVRIVDAEGNTTPAGAAGELCTRGYSVMMGYWDDAEKTAEAIDGEGWMHTGDLATIDEDGYCNIVGRIKDMVIRGGENVYPREIEEFLYRHPKVQDVQVIGVPDAKYGEELCAWIKLKAGQTSSPEEIRQFCEGQIAHFKIPRYVKFVDAFPMTITGKIQKYLMRQQMQAELGLIEEKTA